MTTARTTLLVAVITLLCGAQLAPVAAASQLLDRNASDVGLEVDRSGAALVTYRVHGSIRHVVASGAVNALAPTTTRPQVAFRLAYGSGVKPFGNTCKPFKPALAWLVTACRAADGSAWAVQSWQRRLPNYGTTPNQDQAAWELRLSHWSGELSQLTIRFGWAYHRYQQLYGTLTYLGNPVHGFRSTPSGEPLDTFGRNLYLDTLDSAYGQGWKRENSFLTHKSGGFCYGFYRHGPRPSGAGTRYRATVIG